MRGADYAWLVHRTAHHPVRETPDRKGNAQTAVQEGDGQASPEGGAATLSQETPPTPPAPLTGRPETDKNEIMMGRGKYRFKNPNSKAAREYVNIPSRFSDEERRRILQESANDPEMHHWYENHRKRVNELFDGDERLGTLFSLCLGVTSARTSVGANYKLALKAMHAILHNKEFRGIKAHRDAVEIVRRGYHAGLSAKEIVSQIRGPKIQPYTGSLVGVVTLGANDMHVGEFYIGTRPKNLRHHARIDDLIDADAEALGWSREKVQSAAWASNLRLRGEKLTTYHEYSLKDGNRFLLHKLKESIRTGIPMDEKYLTARTESDYVKLAREEGFLPPKERKVRVSRRKGNAVEWIECDPDDVEKYLSEGFIMESPSHTVDPDEEIPENEGQEPDALGMGMTLLHFIGQGIGVPDGPLKRELANKIPNSHPSIDVTPLQPYADRLSDALKYDPSDVNVRVVDIGELIPTRDEDLNQKFLAGMREHPVTSAAKYMSKAIVGEIPKRAPILVRQRPDGKYDVIDGNATTVAIQRVRRTGVKVPVVVQEQKETSSGSSRELAQRIGLRLSEVSAIRQRRT